MKIIVHLPRTGKGSVVTCDEVTARFARKYRTKSRRTIPGFGTMREVEEVGPNTKRLELRMENPVSGNGRQGVYPRGPVTVEPLQVRDTVRVLASEDEAQLDRMDEDIEELRRQLSSKRDERDEYLRKSWRRAGKSIYPGELIEQAQQIEAARAAN